MHESAVVITNLGESSAAMYDRFHSTGLDRDRDRDTLDTLIRENERLLAEIGKRENAIAKKISSQ